MNRIDRVLAIWDDDSQPVESFPALAAFLRVVDGQALRHLRAQRDQDKSQTHQTERVDLGVLRLVVEVQT